MANVLRILSGAALLVVVVAGCGGAAPQGSASQRLPRALAQDWEAQASAIATAADAGNDCRAMRLAASLSAEVAASRHKLPLRLRSPLLTGVNDLAARISTCTRDRDRAGAAQAAARPEAQAAEASPAARPRQGRRQGARQVSAVTRVAGRYELVRPLGHGAMATVDLAHDVELDRPVALKRLAENLARDEELRRRFVREARLAARLAHPNVVRVFDVGEDDGRPFIAMEYVEGETLAELVARRGRLPAGEAASARHADVRRARRRSRRRSRPPRREAAEPPARHRRRPQARRLRHRRRPRGNAPHARRHRARHRRAISHPSRPAASRSPPPRTSTRSAPCSTSC